MVIVYTSCYGSHTVFYIYEFRMILDLNYNYFLKRL
jgi:hypothetical protein